ncbi:Os07g0519725 [Oryza sativa Japonica Group]|uniref:Os07g0519725 protein n=1 Tax=Oryza sativa subsp. japonica TaxID=39947 RepID=A0A0P0X6E2_ORYSJ|nr:Os07g0519725 [Oryza sativa Japonica Group]
MAAGQDRQVRPRVEAVAVRRADGAPRRAGGEQGGVPPRGAGAQAATEPGDDILGRKNILELVSALMQFLKPEMLRRYVGKIDGEVRSGATSPTGGPAAAPSRCSR